MLMGMGLNLEVGLAGLLDLGFVAFYAVGAYVTAFSWPIVRMHWPICVLGGHAYRGPLFDHCRASYLAFRC